MHTFFQQDLQFIAVHVDDKKWYCVGEGKQGIQGNTSPFRITQKTCQARYRNIFLRRKIYLSDHMNHSLLKFAIFKEITDPIIQKRIYFPNRTLFIDSLVTSPWIATSNAGQISPSMRISTWVFKFKQIPMVTSTT